MYKILSTIQFSNLFHNTITQSRFIQKQTLQPFRTSFIVGSSQSLPVASFSSFGSATESANTQSRISVSVNSSHGATSLSKLTNSLKSVPCKSSASLTFSQFVKISVTTSSCSLDILKQLFLKFKIVFFHLHCCTLLLSST